MSRGSVLIDGRCWSTEEKCLRPMVVASVVRRDWCLGRQWLTKNENEQVLLSIDEKRIPLRIERSEHAESDENSS